MKKIYILLLALAFILPVGVMGFWTEPTKAPPDGNTSAPINVGNASQIKLGSFSSIKNISGYILNGLAQVSSKKFCLVKTWVPLVEDCTPDTATTWKEVIEKYSTTKIIAGEGVTVSTNTNTGAVTISTTNVSTGGSSLWGESIFGGHISNKNAGDVIIEHDAKVKEDLLIGGKTYFGGQIQIAGGAPGPGKILVSTDASGNAVWKNVAEVCPTPAPQKITAGTGVKISTNPNTGEITISTTVSPVNPTPDPNAGKQWCSALNRYYDPSREACCLKGWVRCPGTLRCAPAIMSCY